jgi:hypothetical protein
MKSFHYFCALDCGVPGLPAKGLPIRRGRQKPWLCEKAMVLAVIAASCLGTASLAYSQVVPAAERGGLIFWAGASGSGYNLQYGERKILGVSGFIDAETRGRLGAEGEARWLIFHRTTDVKAETYMGGPTYHFDLGRFQPYGKALVGVGEFSFPYGYGRGSYLVLAPGGGLDIRISRRVQIRAADFEYQVWPQFTFNTMSSYGVSSGIRIRVF